MPELDPNIYQGDRVIYKKLPGEHAEFLSYDYITDSGRLIQYWELQLKAWNRSMLNFTQFAGDLRIFTDEQLDALAVYFGFEGDFYNEQWEKESKARLFEGTYKEPLIWRFRGNKEVFLYICYCLFLDVILTRPDGFIVGRDTPGEVIGTPDYNHYLLIIPDEYQPNTEKYSQVIWTVDRFMPLWVKLDIEYISEQD